jgi:hypothetical protein
MLKSPKSRKPAKKSTPKKARAKSKSQAASPGRLIAVEGTRGKQLSNVAPRLARQFGRNGSAAWSLWDASNTFYELSLNKSKSLAAPPRTLLLLYASDLMFRLRWEIEPALQEGRTVFAAPYVQSAIAFGLAVGLSKDWLDELFSFARKPDAALRLKEKPKKKTGNPGSGFVEFCCGTLAATSPDWDPAALRGAVQKYLDSLEDRQEIVRVGKKVPKELLAELRGRTSNPH